MGSFPEWVRVVGGILGAAGYEGFLEHRASLADAMDPETADWCDFLNRWHEAHEGRLVPVRELLPLAEAAGIHINGETEAAQTRSLGRSIGQRRDRFFGAFQIRQGTGRARREWRLAGSVTSRDISDPNSSGLRGPARALARVQTGESGVPHGTTCHTPDAALELTWSRIGSAEAQIEREAIQAEAEEACP
jgi:hypothetical protein